MVRIAYDKLHPIDFTHKALARFWSRVDTSGDCWEYSGPGNNKNYKWFSYKGRRYATHRISYQLLGGDIPKDYVIDHLCRNPGCVNPDHLEPVTNYVNVMVRGHNNLFALNLSKTHCVHGHEFDEANTRISANGRRNCRACHREERKRNYDAAKKHEAYLKYKAKLQRQLNEDSKDGTN